MSLIQQLTFSGMINTLDGQIGEKVLKLIILQMISLKVSTVSAHSLLYTCTDIYITHLIYCFTEKMGSYLPSSAAHHKTI